jgi:hypothetical protein
VAGCCECGDELSASVATELVNLVVVFMLFLHIVNGHRRCFEIWYGTNVFGLIEVWFV